MPILIVGRSLRTGCESQRRSLRVGQELLPVVGSCTVFGGTWRRRAERMLNSIRQKDTWLACS